MDVRHLPRTADDAAPHVHSHLELPGLPTPGPSSERDRQALAQSFAAALRRGVEGRPTKTS